MKVHRPRPLTSRPRVSIVIPCYNYGRFLDDAVAAALNQPSLDLEVIVVDDASTDDSLAVARRLEISHPEVRVIAHRTNQGHLATYEDGLASTTSAYVALVSADDSLTPGSLTRAVALMEALPGVGLVYGNARAFTGRIPAQRPGLETWSTWSGPEWIRAVCHLGMNRILSPEAVLRTSLMRELGGFDRNLPHAADFHVWLRAAARADVGRVNGVTQAYYRLHAGNMHLTVNEGIELDLVQRYETFRLLFARDAARIPDAPALEAMARRALTREALLARRKELDADTPDPDLVEAMGRVAALMAPAGPTIRRPSGRYRPRPPGGLQRGCDATRSGCAGCSTGCAGSRGRSPPDRGREWTPSSPEDLGGAPLWWWNRVTEHGRRRGNSRWQRQ